MWVGEGYFGRGRNSIMNLALNSHLHQGKRDLHVTG